MFPVARKLTLLLPLGVVSCAQFTTNSDELAELKRAGDAQADAYVECVSKEAASITGDMELELVQQAVAERCSDNMKAFQAAQKKYLSAQYMMTKKPLGIATAELEQRGQAEVNEVLIARGATENAMPQASPAAAAAVATAPAAPAVTEWNPDQRVYLDCMADQAQTYATLNESAEAIAAVAASKCSNYLTSERRGALEQEGKVRVMTQIMDARVSGGR